MPGSSPLVGQNKIVEARLRPQARRRRSSISRGEDAKTMEARGRPSAGATALTLARRGVRHGHRSSLVGTQSTRWGQDRHEPGLMVDRSGWRSARSSPCRITIPRAVLTAKRRKAMAPRRAAGASPRACARPKQALTIVARCIHFLLIRARTQATRSAAAACQCRHPEAAGQDRTGCSATIGPMILADRRMPPSSWRCGRRRPSGLSAVSLHEGWPRADSGGDHGGRTPTTPRRRRPALRRRRRWQSRFRMPQRRASAAQ